MERERAGSDASGTVHPQAHIGHVHLKVTGLDRAIAPFGGVLGFEMTQQYGEQAAFLSAGGYHYHSELPPTTTPGSSSMRQPRSWGSE
jgi:catechol 2,3-dioxygenase